MWQGWTGGQGSNTALGCSQPHYQNHGEAHPGLAAEKLASTFLTISVQKVRDGVGLVGNGLASVSW